MRTPSAAKAAKLSYGHFSRYFKQRTGMTFRQWVRGERLARAVGLLDRNPWIPLADAYRQAGFGSIRAMERAFKAELGTTARRYAANRKSRAVRVRDFAPRKAELYSSLLPQAEDPE